MVEPKLTLTPARGQTGAHTMTDRQMLIANQLEKMDVGQTIHFSDLKSDHLSYEIKRITDEIYQVNGERHGFYEAYRIIAV